MRLGKVQVLLLSPLLPLLLLLHDVLAAVLAQTTRAMGKATFSRLDAFARGQICGMRAAGTARRSIRKTVKKTDGTSPTLRAVDGVLAMKKADPEWRGEPSRAGGRPRALTKAQTKELLNLVFAERGKAKVTASYCRKRLPFLREVSADTVRRELYHAGLAWLRRRRKTSVPGDWRKKREAYCRWLLKLTAEEARRFAYTDGTTFYLARGPGEGEQKQRAALGPCVWRMASGKDGLWDENIGPSLCDFADRSALCRRTPS